MKSKPIISWGLALLKKKDPADILRSLPDLLFPENLYCACCGDTIDRKTRVHSLCDKCIKMINWISDNPYASSMDDLAFDDLFSCCIYGYYPRQMISKLKFQGAGYLARPMAKLMAERILLSYGNNLNELKRDFDCISFVPSSKEKMSKRGYNQAQLLAKYLSKELDIELADLLLKPKETPPARLAGKRERKEILVGAFSLDPNAGIKGRRLKGNLPLKGLRIILVDDVLTTGSTASEAAFTLKDAGCSYVAVSVFACGNGMISRGE